MKLLICTQAVDLDDPVLGFFHRWIEEFAARFEHVEVVCLKEGRHALPENVSVHSLGKESGVSRITYLVRFYRYIWTLRRQYDAVFVHMNQEYVILGWKLWWLLRKRIVLWRNHKKGSSPTRIAALVSHRVCYTSPDAYVAGYGNAVRMPIGIDTRVFVSRGDAPPDSILFLGRLDAVKRPDVFLAAMEILQKEGSAAHADVYGDPTPGRELYARELRERFAKLSNVVFHPAVRNEETPALYAAHRVYVNLTPSGSFDKTLGEAMASGCIVVAANNVLRGVLPDTFIAGETPESVAACMRSALALGDTDRRALAHHSRTYVEHEHALPLLAERLAGILQA